jgi:hypothetical protein
VIDIKQTLKDWNPLAARIRKPTIEDGCKIIEDLCLEIRRLEAEVAHQKKRQDCKEQEYKTMLVEMHNVLHKYS